MRTLIVILLVAWVVAAAERPVAAAEPTPASAAPASTAANVWKSYTVRSPSSGKIERFWVGHSAALKPDGKYPVIYFLPGLLDGDDNWKAALDPHLGKFEVIAVCPAVGGATWFMNSPRQTWMRWGDYLNEELRTFIEANYPASAEKGQRGIAGISVGGHGAFYNAITRPELYTSVSVLSGAVDMRGYVGTVGLEYWVGPRGTDTLRLYAERSCLLLAARQNGPLPFTLYLDMGDKDGALSQMTALRKALDSKGYVYRWNVGTGEHNYAYWNTRAEDHLAWHTEQFARNRRENRQTTVAPTSPTKLEVLTGPPDIAISADALTRLQAPWEKADLKPAAVTGLPKAGAPLALGDPKYKSVELKAPLSDVQGHEPAIRVYRMTVAADTPVPAEGTVLVTGHLSNGRGATILTIPATALPMPAGAPDRRVELRARLVVELLPPDPLRGGIIAGFQVFDAEGKPLGPPIVAKARPGTLEAERWPIAPQAQSDWTVFLGGGKALPVAAIRDFRLEAEAAPAK